MLSLAEFKEKLSVQGTVDWSLSPTVEYFWSFEMRATREEIWSYLSDTSRLNREMGFAPRQEVEENGKVSVTTKVLGIQQKWVEQPWTWLAGHTMTSTRIYVRGLAKKMYSVFYIDSDSNTGCRNIYIYFGWIPSNRFWRYFLLKTGSILQKNFAKAFIKLDQHFAKIHLRQENAFKANPPALSESAMQKIVSIKENLISRNLKADVVEKLADVVIKGDDLDLEPFRVLLLARNWKINEKDLLSTCLHATRLGLLKLSWDVICPHCRGSRYSAQSLGELPELANCDICDIEFSTSEASSIEVMFHVHPAIRKVEALLYCAAEPAKKNHIKVQQLVNANGELSLNLELTDGIHRARVIGEKWETKLDVSQEHPGGILEFDGVKTEIQAGRQIQIKYKNKSAEPVIFVLEELRWETSALKPAQILALPEFRDLFSEEHLSSNVKLFLGDQTILFTDIVGSTKFYNNVGDAKAFAEVRTHFQDVFKEVQAHNGVVVKTIGDAVMASFGSSQDGIAAAIRIQEAFNEGRADTTIRLRISVHCGPVIAVHLNTGIDYFGNTVNYAAKIQAVAGAGEIALSEDAFHIYNQYLNKGYRVDKRINQRDGGIPGEIYVIKPVALSKVA